MSNMINGVLEHLNSKNTLDLCGVCYDFDHFWSIMGRTLTENASWKIKTTEEAMQFVQIVITNVREHV